ncbi:cell surface protein [Methanolobus psychrophilus R15]|nr:cell surface protein [Methanolobus psychrophilus R15]
MKIKQTNIILIMIILFAISVSNASAIETAKGSVAPISHTEHFSPAIYEDKTVWVENHPYSGSNIYLYNLSSNTGKQISTSGSAASPAIYNDMIIWLDGSNFTRKLISVDDKHVYSGNSNIHIYDISSGEETQITTSESIKGSPEIYEDKIVWSDYRNGNLGIYMYDLSAGEESEITSHPYQGDYVGLGEEIIDGESQIIYAPAESIDLAIYGNTIAWENNSTIYMYDILTGEEKRVTNDEAMIFAGPAVYEDKIVWSDLRDYPNSPAYYPISLSDIYMYNISSGEEIQVTTNETLGYESLKFSPVIYEDVIVWADSTSIAGPSHIHMYKISSGEASQLPTAGWYFNMNDQSLAIYGNRIVWEGWTYDTSHIGLFTLNEQILPDPEDPIQEPIGDTPDEVPVDDEVPIDEVPVEEAPIGEDPVEEVPVEKAPVEKAPVEEAPVEETPVEKEPADEVLVDEEVPVEEDPVEEAPVEEAPVEKEPTDEDPVEKGHVDELPVVDKTTERAKGIETRITTSISSFNPVIYGDWIAWENYFHQSVSLFNIPTKEEIILTSEFGSSPAIYENEVVWFDIPRHNATDDHHFAGFYLYDISSGESSPVIELDSFGNIVFSDDILVWQDYRNRNWDIYMYCLSLEEERQITSQPSDQINPAAHGNIIVWQDNRSGNWDVYMYDISTGEEQQITTDTSDQTDPAIHKDKIVWQDYRNGNWDIYMYDIFSGEETQITTNQSHQREPAIYGDRIVWVDERNVAYIEDYIFFMPEIYMYDISTGKEFRITEWAYSDYIFTETHWREGLAIYENRIVWSDSRGGMDHFDIFMFTLDEQAPPVQEDPIKALEELQDYISGMEGVNTGTKNSLNANLKNAIHMLEMGDAEKSIDRLSKIIASIEGQLLPKDRLSTEQAEYLTSELQRIIELIESSDVVIIQDSASEETLEDVTVEEEPIEESTEEPGEETPADEETVDDAPAEEAPVNESFEEPVDDKEQVDDTPIEEETVEEVTVEEPVEEDIAEETPVEEKAPENSATEEMVVEETLAE